MQLDAKRRVRLKAAPFRRREFAAHRLTFAFFVRTLHRRRRCLHDFRAPGAGSSSISRKLNVALFLVGAKFSRSRPAASVVTP